MPHPVPQPSHLLVYEMPTHALEKRNMSGMHGLGEIAEYIRIIRIGLTACVKSFFIVPQRGYFLGCVNSPLARTQDNAA